MTFTFIRFCREFNAEYFGKKLVRNNERSKRYWENTDPFIYSGPPVNTDYFALVMVQYGSVLYGEAQN